MNKLILVKLIVIILTFLLVFGSLTALGKIYKLSKKPSPKLPAELILDEPQGSTIDTITEINRSLHLLIKNGGKSDRIIIIDPQSGAKISTIRLN